MRNTVEQRIYLTRAKRSRFPRNYSNRIHEMTIASYSWLLRAFDISLNYYSIYPFNFNLGNRTSVYLGIEIEFAKVIQPVVKSMALHSNRTVDGLSTISNSSPVTTQRSDLKRANFRNATFDDIQQIPQMPFINDNSSNNHGVKCGVAHRRRSNFFTLF